MKRSESSTERISARVASGMRRYERLRARVPDGQVPFVVSHANDWLGYAVTRHEYKKGGYEACLSFHGRNLGNWLIESGASLLQELDARE